MHRAPVSVCTQLCQTVWVGSCCAAVSAMTCSGEFIKSLYAGVTEQEAVQLLAGAREKLHARRKKRSRPHLDDKVCYLRNASASRSPRLYGLGGKTGYRMLGSSRQSPA